MALNQGASVLIDERIVGEVAAVGEGDSMEAGGGRMGFTGAVLLVKSPCRQRQAGSPMPRGVLRGWDAWIVRAACRFRVHPLHVSAEVVCCQTGFLS